MKKFLLPVSLVLFCASALVSCASCSNQPVNQKPEELKLLWSFAYTQEIDGLSTVTLRPALVPNGEVITALDHQYNSLSQNDGSLSWQRSLPENMYESVKKLTYDHRYLYGKGNRNSSYFAIDLQNGKMVWQETNAEGLFDDYVHDGLDNHYLYLTGDGPMLYVFDKQTGNYEDTIQMQYDPRAVVSTGKQLYITHAWKPDSTESAYGQIIALDAKTYRKIWQYETIQGGFYYADLVLKDGVLYSGTTSGPSVFVALDAATGQVKWELDGYWCYRFTLGDGKIFINDSNYILAVDQQTGEVLWEDYFQGHTESNLAYLDGYLYHAHNGGLFIWNAQTGERVAGPILSPDGSGFYNLNAVNGRVFVQTDFHLYAYEAYNAE